MEEKRGMVALFEEVPDPRVERTRRHKLVDILVITLVATICGCSGWDAMYDLAEGGEERFSDAARAAARDP